MKRRWAALLVVGCLSLSACKPEEPAPAPEPSLTRAQLMDPETCKDCHPQHYNEWKASMHAYASEDPVFRAMNALGQEETGGELGDFCVKCHAPMAVRERATDDGLNLDEVPEHLHGVTCYTCHNTVDVIGEHNAELVLADDTTMRGAIVDPVKPSAHGVAFSRFLDSNNPESSKLCGGCHDIETPDPHNVHLERTFAEYKETPFSREGPGLTTCSGCHMIPRTGVAAVDESSAIGSREVHSHLFPAVDVPLTPWPNQQASEDAVMCELSNAIGSVSLAVAGDVMFTVSFSNEAGHRMPSGASQDRRLWLEIVAYDENDQVICSKGAVPNDEAAATFVDPRECALTSGQWLYRDRIFDENGDETHMFWRAAKSDAHPLGYEIGSLAATTDFGIPHTQVVEYMILGASRVTMRLRMRPMDYDVLEELVETEHLDPAILERIPTFTLMNTALTWRKDDDVDVVTVAEPFELDCPTVYECVFDPGAPQCADAGTP